MRPILLIILTAISLITLGQPVIHIPYGGAPSIDGTVSAGEWDDAGFIEISILGNNEKVKVLFKHDSTSLYLAFLNHLESSNIRFPEVMLDINNDKSPAWMSDDWWFHVSATDCEYQGDHSNYSNCALVRPNWTAEPNILPGAPVTDSVEIKIPFSTINYNFSIDTIGIAFDVTNTFNSWEYWPATALIDNPGTWANAVFSSGSVGINQYDNGDLFSIFPNPNAGSIKFITKNIDAPYEIFVYNEAGQLMLQQKYAAGMLEDEINLNKGIYLLKFISPAHSFTKKVIVY